MKLPIDIAKEVGVSVSHIHKINAGERVPSDDLVVAIIKAMAARGETVTVADLKPKLVEVL